MIRTDDPFIPVLRQFLESCYEPFTSYSSYNPDPEHPLIFHDRHIASALLLKNVKHGAWIMKELSNLCEDTIKDFTAAGHTFIENRNYWEKFRRPSEYVSYCEDIAKRHFVRTSIPCNAYASKLLFSPNDPIWFNFINARLSGSHIARRSFCCTGDTAIIKPEGEDTGDRKFKIPPETRSTLGNRALSNLNKLRDMDNIFNYEFFVATKTAEALLDRMGCWGEFKWEMPTVTGAHVLPASLPGKDSPFIQSLFPLLGVEPLRPLPIHMGTSSRKSAHARKVVAPLTNTRRAKSKYRINVHHYIQKAWIDAVHTDATFIVFSCGRQERIAIRHRQSQTLFLSDLIDPTKIPGYRKIHLGLTIAAIKDRLERWDPIEVENRRPSKRKEPPGYSSIYNSMKDKATRRKRRRLNPELGLTSVEMDKKAFDDELAKRDLVLFYLNYSYMSSPAPSAFRRMEPSCASRPFQNHSYHFKRKASYSPARYILATTYQDDIGSGAVGLVYRVTVEIEIEDGSKHQRTLILKLAIGDKKDQIIQEYEIYKRLAEANATYGIVGVHGLFHDMETDALMMIMDDGGMSLRTRAIEKKLKIHYDWDDSVETAEKERDAFIKALKGIHHAHVIHQDIRIDNLMINDAGDVFIIDFDNGRYDPLHESFEYERDMEELLTAIGWLDSDDDTSESDEDEDKDEDKDDGDGQA
ncbi:Mitogen-activated protein kinase kinase 5 [Psilocybe cubensis]|uniref:Protein kinase domain-containing protein n=2 Tax=Psilocybe cubensis TaxID=181762 RepID=A0A8H8CIF9_PSICU|nr:Mitogen-activated protein kinase kinase 5 [Psilocybe cubensis]KAH9474857.1 Mitogen-activated protein kinase kinase 5 [Psilocybe cubensis]